MYDLREKVRVDTRLGGLGGLTMSVWNPPSWTGNGQVFFDPGATCSLDPLQRPQSDTRNEPVYAPGT